MFYTVMHMPQRGGGVKLIVFTIQGDKVRTRVMKGWLFTEITLKLQKGYQ